MQARRGVSPWEAPLLYPPCPTVSRVWAAANQPLSPSRTPTAGDSGGMIRVDESNSQRFVGVARSALDDERACHDSRWQSPLDDVQISQFDQFLGKAKQ